MPFSSRSFCSLFYSFVFTSFFLLSFFPVSLCPTSLSALLCLSYRFVLLSTPLCLLAILLVGLQGLRESTFLVSLASLIPPSIKWPRKDWIREGGCSSPSTRTLAEDGDQVQEEEEQRQRGKKGKSSQKTIHRLRNREEVAGRGERTKGSDALLHQLELSQKAVTRCEKSKPRIRRKESGSKKERIAESSSSLPFILIVSHLFSSLFCCLSHYGLHLCLSALSFWNRDHDPLTPLRIAQHAQRLREELDRLDQQQSQQQSQSQLPSSPLHGSSSASSTLSASNSSSSSSASGSSSSTYTKYFSDLILKNFCNNPHRFSLTMRPDSSFLEKIFRNEQEQLTTAAKSLSEADKSRIVAEAQELKKEQQAIQNPDILPTLTVADIAKKTPLVEVHTSTLATHQLHNKCDQTEGKRASLLVLSLSALSWFLSIAFCFPFVLLRSLLSVGSLLLQFSFPASQRMASPMSLLSPRSMNCQRTSCHFCLSTGMISSSSSSSSSHHHRRRRRQSAESQQRRRAPNHRGKEPLLAHSFLFSLTFVPHILSVSDS